MKLPKKLSSKKQNEKKSQETTERSDIFNIKSSKFTASTGGARRIATRHNPLVLGTIVIGLLLVGGAGYSYLQRSNDEPQDTAEQAEEEISYAPSFDDQFAENKTVAQNQDLPDADRLRPSIDAAYLAFIRNDSEAVVLAAEALSIMDRLELSGPDYDPARIDMQAIIDGTYVLPE